MSEQEQLLAGQARLAALLEEARQLDGLLARAPQWLAARPLRAECGAATQLLAGLPQRLERKLVITLIGPGGVGKSTLLNALVGAEVSPASVKRPGTRLFTAVVKDASDATPLIDSLGAGELVVRSTPRAAQLQHALLVDTPDFNTDSGVARRALLERLLGQSDVVLCVLENQSLANADYRRYLYSVLRNFPAAAIYLVVNQVDLWDEPAEQLAQRIQSLRAELPKLWPAQPIKDIFTVSAVAHLFPSAATTPSGGEPRPSDPRDQFDRLHRVVFFELSGGRLLVDARLRQADHLVANLKRRILEAMAAHELNPAELQKAVLQMEQGSLQVGLEALQGEPMGVWSDADAQLRRRVARGFLGPVGWLVAAWARLSLLGRSKSTLPLPGRPRGARALPPTSAEELQGALRLYHRRLRADFLKLADGLVQIGFADALRDEVPQASEHTTAMLVSLWQDSCARAVTRIAERLTRPLVQVLANAPILGLLLLLLGHTSWSFYAQHYLSADYIHHAIFLLVLVWVISFTCVQTLIAKATGARLLSEILHKQHAADPIGLVSELPIYAQLAALRQCEQLCRTQSGFNPITTTNLEVQK